MLVEKLFEALYCSMPHPELSEVITAAVNIANHSIKVNYDQILVLQSFSPLEQDPSRDVRRLWRLCWHMLFSEAPLTELDLSTTQLVSLTSLILVLEGMTSPQAFLPRKGLLSAVEIGSRLILGVLLGFSNN